MRSIMQKKALLILIPFLLIFLSGLFLFLRPQYEAQVIEVVRTFSRQEKTGMRSSHRHTVYYADVKIELDGTMHIVTVHDHTWKPLEAGDSVVVTQGLSGKIVEYNTENARRMMLFSVSMGPLCLLLFRIISIIICRKAESQD